MFKGIFPIACYETILTDDFSKLKDFARNVEYRDAMPNQPEVETSLTGASHNRVLEHPDLSYIKKTLMFHFNYFKDTCLTLASHDKVDTCITTSWFARIKKGGKIHNHNHCNSWYSGLLYFDDDYTNAAPLALENPIAVFNHFDTNNDSDVSSCPDVFYEVIPQPNKIFFFPSYLKHMSATQKGDKTRYSLAWNIYPKGKIGHDDSDSYFDTRWLSS